LDARNNAVAVWSVRRAVVESFDNDSLLSSHATVKKKDDLACLEELWVLLCVGRHDCGWKHRSMSTRREDSTCPFSSPTGNGKARTIGTAQWSETTTHAANDTPVHSLSMIGQVAAEGIG